VGIEGISKSQVSEIAKSLDGVVDAFRSRPLAGPYPYIWLDALVVRCRDDAMRMAGVCCLVAVGVNPEGRREVLGLELVSTEDGAGWLGFLRGLLARGLSGVQLVISDAHPGLVEAARSVLAGAAWQRCRQLSLAYLDAVIAVHASGCPGAIAGFIAAALEQYPFFEFVALNVHVTPDGRDRATVRTYMCELRQDHAGRPSRAFGLYQDTVTRVEPGVWRFARRNYQSMGRGEYGLDLMPMPVVLASPPPGPRTG